MSAAAFNDPCKQIVAPDPDVIFDVQLVRIDRVSRLWVFAAAGRIYVLGNGRSGWWEIGTIGRLWKITANRDFEFTAYPDQRLRRCWECDDPTRSRWGWQLGEYRFSVKAGVIPGKDGAVLREDTESLEVAIPRELVDLCRRRGISSARLLRGFIADLCDLHNGAGAPREDGFESSGAEQRYWAQEYFRCADQVWEAEDAATSGGFQSVPERSSRPSA